MSSRLGGLIGAAALVLNIASPVRAQISQAQFQRTTLEEAINDQSDFKEVRQKHIDRLASEVIKEIGHVDWINPFIYDHSGHASRAQGAGWIYEIMNDQILFNLYSRSYTNVLKAKGSTISRIELEAFEKNPKVELENLLRAAVDNFAYFSYIFQIDHPGQMGSKKKSTPYVLAKVFNPYLVPPQIKLDHGFQIYLPPSDDLVKLQLAHGINYAHGIYHGIDFGNGLRLNRSNSTTISPHVLMFASQGKAFVMDVEYAAKNLGKEAHNYSVYTLADFQRNMSPIVSVDRLTAFEHAIVYSIKDSISKALAQSPELS